MRCLISLLLLFTSCFAQPAPNPAFREIRDVAGLPRVLLIGDSISIGYTEPVRAHLTGKANIHRIPTNGATTANGLKNLDAWLGTGRWHVIHFNFGLHDLRLMDSGHQIPIADYQTNLRAIIQRLQKTGARLIWATTTPVPNAVVNPPRRSADVLEYNAAAQKIVEESGIAVNDLYGAAYPRLRELQIPANVHFTLPGYQALGELVVQSILKALIE